MFIMHFGSILACWSICVSSFILTLCQLKPGLSAYPNDPRQSANSLVTLLDKAEASVPRELRSKTPVRVGVWKRVPFTHRQIKLLMRLSIFMLII